MTVKLDLHTVLSLLTIVGLILAGHLLHLDQERLLGTLATGLLIWQLSKR